MRNKVRVDISVLDDSMVSYFTQTLRLIDLWNNQVQDEGVEHLTPALSKNKARFTSTLALYTIYRLRQTLTHLYLGKNEITDDGAKHMANALEKNEVR